MKRSWQIFVLWVFWVFVLWLMVPCLDPKHEWAPQEKWINMVPWRCCCPWFKCRISGYPSRTLNYSLCHDTVRRDQFDAGNQKMKGYLMGAAESTSPNAVLWWLGMHSASELGKVWKKLLEAIPRPSVSHLHLFCGSCALTGNSKILRATSLHSNVNQYSVVSRMNQVPVQGFETLGNQTTGCFISHRNARDQGSWRQLLLLLPKLFDLAWTSDVLSEEDVQFGFESEKQGKWSHYWEDVNQTNCSKKVLSMHSTEAETEVSSCDSSPLAVNTGECWGCSSRTMGPFRGKGQEEVVL